MITPGATLRRTFSSLRIRNYRLYFIGQTISVSGVWMQRVAQSWLVLDLTGSGTAVGLVTALQFLPILVLAPLGGVVADRVDKRRLLYVTQSAAGVIAAVLGVLVVAGLVQLWMIFVLAGALGVAGSLDVPTRQAFVLEMVGREAISNAISLNSVLVNLARVLGPSAAGVIIVTAGTGPAFLINAVSHIALISALLMMRPEELASVPPKPRTSRQLREGLRYVRSTPAVLTPLLLMAVAGTFAYEYQIVLPLFARFVFDGNAATYATMTAVMGAGAVVGGLVSAWRRTQTIGALGPTAMVFGVVQILVAMAPTLDLALAGLALLGATSILFLALGNATLQLNATPQMRGRVMGLWAVAFLGSTPVGGPITGWIGEHIGARYALGLGGAATLIAALASARRLTAVDRDALAPEVDVPGEKLTP